MEGHDTKKTAFVRDPETFCTFTVSAVIPRCVHVGIRRERRMVSNCSTKAGVL